MTQAAGRLTRKENAQARRQALLDAACALIAERGFEPVSIIEIGGVAGVTGAAIYRHFTSKADILAVLCGQTIDRLIEFVGPRRPQARSELAALVEGQVKLVVTYPSLVRVFEDEQRSLPEETRREIRRRERQHAQRWVEVLRRLAPDTPLEDLEAVTFAVVGMILSSPRWPRSLRSSPATEANLLGAAWRVLSPYVDGGALARGPSENVLVNSLDGE
jgi:AcrR family transcriptional regulator